MKLPRFHCLAALALSIVLTTAASANEIDALSWMSGCWAGGDQNHHNEECWLHPGGDMMLGLSRTISPNSASFEFLRIAPLGDGLAYLASPSGSPPTAFRLVEVAPGRAVCSNPEHDFPQRITYSLDGDTLRADVEALEGEEWKGFTIVWTRASLTH